MKQRPFLALILIAVVVLAGNAFAIDQQGGNCIQGYMNDLERCIHMSDLVAGNICHMDATLDYVGCIRSTLLF